jgi:Ribbon-helix-helix protein, copG family
MAGKDFHQIDARLDDPDEWDESSSEEVTPRPSGMTVFSLRLPVSELVGLKEEAARRGTTMSELARDALRFYLLPRASGSLSATGVTYVTSFTPAYVGGRANHAHVQVEHATQALGAIGPS